MTTFACIAIACGLAFAGNLWYLNRLILNAPVIEDLSPFVPDMDSGLVEDDLVAALDDIYYAPAYEGVRP